MPSGSPAARAGLRGRAGADRRADAYVLCSLAGDLKISAVVDAPHVLVSMHMPKRVLGM